MTKQTKPRRLLRPREIQERLGIRTTKFYELVKAGEIKLFSIGGGRARAAYEHEVEALMERCAAARE
jgi:predicted DNA-binding transcriptional regulator AlpA